MTSLTTSIYGRYNGAATGFKNKIFNGKQQLEKMEQSAGAQFSAMESSVESLIADTMKSSQDRAREDPLWGSLCGQ
jgi:hypothetical protein